MSQDVVALFATFPAKNKDIEYIYKNVKEVKSEPFKLKQDKSKRM